MSAQGTVWSPSSVQKTVQLFRIPLMKTPSDQLSARASSITSSEEMIVADLGEYIESCYYGEETVPSERHPIFNQEVGHYGPQLKQDRVNRIILYPGCFNPPHCAHQALVNCAFLCSQDIDVIAAIVLPVGAVNSSRSSLKRFGDVWLTTAQRARLWRGDNEPNDWLWVYDQGTKMWENFRSSLEYATANDGFSLEFIYLGGPDHIGRSHVQRGPWGCDNMIVSDVGREADFVREDNTLIRIERHGNWRQILYQNRPHPWETVREMAPWLLSSLSLIMSREKSDTGSIEELQREYIRMVTGMRICSNKDNNRLWVRFIPADDGAIRMSSTDIRYTINTCPPDELLEKLKGKALHPELLVQWVQESKNPPS